MTPRGGVPGGSGIIVSYFGTKPGGRVAGALAAVLALSAGPAAPGQTAPSREVAAVRVGRLFTGTEWLEPGVVTIAGGKVRAVGRDLPAAVGEGRVIDLPDAWATPGWIDAAATAGIPGLDFEIAREVTPLVRPLRSFDPESRPVRDALASGVTSLFLEPGHGNVVGGIASVVKTAPAADGAPRVVAETAALKIAFGSEPSWGNFPARGMPRSIYARRPTTRMGVVAVLRDAWLLGRMAGPESPDADLAAMARAAAGEIPVRALARHVEDVRTAFRLGEDLGFRPVLEGVLEGWVEPEEIAAAKVGCVVGPLLHPTTGRGVEGTRPALANAAALHGAGVRLALTAGGDGRALRDQAGLHVRYGLPRDAALRGVTSTAAELCGAGDRVGTLLPGRDADLVVFDGDPLEPASRVRITVVDGEVAFEEVRP